MADIPTPNRGSLDLWGKGGDKGGGGKPKGNGGGNNNGVPNIGGDKPTGDGDPWSGEDRNAFVALVDYFTSLGLGSLAPVIKDFLVQGYSPDTISIKLQDTQEYKDRFSGNELIKAALANGTATPGLKVLTPGEYLAQEKQYRDVLTYYGLPAGFYDTPGDFASWIGKGVSVLEIQDRARLAKEAVNNSTDEFKTALREYYGVTEGDLTAYFLDQDKALPILETRAAAAEIGGAANYQGLDVNRQRAEDLAAFGITRDVARQGFSAIADILPTADKLASIDNVNYDQGDAEEEVFKGDAESARKRRKLSSNEQARFSASSGTNQYTFSADKGDY